MSREEENGSILHLCKYYIQKLSRSNMEVLIRVSYRAYYFRTALTFFFFIDSMGCVKV